jgi:2-hydroxychromene-2-carboxylate isomerase
MSIKTILTPVISQQILSRQTLLKKRAAFEKERAEKKLPVILDYFHQMDDPYSYLMAQVLPRFVEKYQVQVRIHLVSAPEATYAPENQKLIDYSRKDAELLAHHYGLTFTDQGTQPNSEIVRRAQQALIEVIDTEQALVGLLNICHAVWGDSSSLPVREVSIENHLHHGNALRDELGHYLGATIYYGKEWYWGIDRLYHLEQRFIDLSLTHKLPLQDKASPYFFAPDQVHTSGIAKAGQDIHFFFSFRSPYSAIVAQRVFDLGKKYQAKVHLRFVLPMVMRGLPVPPKKSRYISHDTAREAFFRDIPFGKLNDPVGAPTERGLALIPLAEKLGCGQEYVVAFLMGVWSEGIDAGSDKGLKKITGRCNMPWDQCQKALADSAWRTRAENNRAELFAAGLWGVPSFKVHHLAVWGQDRLWAVEEELCKTSF